MRAPRRLDDKYDKEYFVYMLDIDVASVISENQALREQNARLVASIAALQEDLAWFKRQMFGAKSERFVPNEQQCELNFGEQFAAGEGHDTFEDVPGFRRRKARQGDAGKHGREPWPANLPRVRRDIEPDFDTSNMKKIDEEITETLQFTPGYFWVLQQVRGVYAPVEPQLHPQIKCPELPPRLIEKGSVGESVVARLLVDKCTFHVPVYRIGKMWEASAGIRIPESDLYDWFATGAFWLGMIRERILQIITASSYLQLDESSIRVQTKEKKGTCHTGNMLVVHIPELRLVCFTYRNSKDKNGPEEVLGAYQGLLQTDACPSYEQFGSRQGITHVACWAHVRRYFDRALRSDRPKAEKALEFCAELFEIEARAQQQQFDANQRLLLRQRESKPVVSAFRDWLDKQVSNALPQERIGKAITYTLNNWDKLTFFLENGRVELSNNWIENVIRLLALGRKNFMFAGSVEGAHNLAIVYSVMATCKLLGINPYEYCSYVLQQLPGRQANDIDDLLPQNWNPETARSGAPHNSGVQNRPTDSRAIKGPTAHSVPHCKSPSEHKRKIEYPALKC
jgi:transposase